MTRIRRTMKRIERLESLPAVVPPPVAEVFELLDAIDRHHPETRGCYPGSLMHPAGHAGAPTPF